jgi:hypothetical protein
MGFSEFINGKSAKEVAYMKQREYENLLEDRHAMEDGYLSVLRPWGEPDLDMRDKFKLWKESR